MIKTCDGCKKLYDTTYYVILSSSSTERDTGYCLKSETIYKEINLCEICYGLYKTKMLNLINEYKDNE